MTHKYKYGIIGNCHFLAYVGDKANIDWLCWPRFDSSFVFGGILDQDMGGTFSISCTDSNAETQQYYLENSNVLATEFKTEQGRFRVIDFAPRFEQFDRSFKPLMLVRKVEVLEGNPRVKVICNPSYDYGRTQLEKVKGSNHINVRGAPNEIRLVSNVSLDYIMEEKPFLLNSNKYFVMTYGRPLEAPLAETAETFLTKTLRYWRQWILRSSIPTVFQKEVIRSSLALKLHQYEDTGGIIAAGTTSLPESPGAPRNWDYRYCWPRDSFYTLMALNRISHFSEVKAYAEFIQNLSVGNSDLQPLYSISGEDEIEESILEHLQGYLGNGPVRIGNKAYIQKQYDVYGQILLSLLPLCIDLRLVHHFEDELPLNLINKLLDGIADTMEKPDAGIWEFRGMKYLHLHTFLFHWAGAKAAKKIGLTYRNRPMVKRAQELIELASTQIEKCYDEKRNVYTTAIDKPDLDASSLLLVTMGYLKDRPEKARKHIDQVYRELKTSNGLLRRYIHQDDFGDTKSAFLVCSFWYVESLAVTGQVQKAKKMLRTVLSSANHLGLFSEDVEGTEFSQWGNFPQTYSHVGLINCAFAIERQSPFAL